MTGTARFVSVNTHLGIQQSRRDDLESLGYVLIYFAKGALPWQGLPANTKKDKYEKIMTKKMDTTEKELTQGLPEEFETYLKYTKKLQFEDQPDIAYLRKLFRDLFHRMGYSYDFVFDWMGKSATKASKAEIVK